MANGYSATNEHFAPKIPRFLIPLTQNYLEYGDKYIKGIYLKNVAKVNGIEVTETNLLQIELIMYKLLSLSNLQEQVRFEPVSMATTMKIGFRVSDDSITTYQNWFGILGHNLLSFGEMKPNQNSTHGFTKIEWCSIKVENTWDEDDKTYPIATNTYTTIDGIETTEEDVLSEELSRLSERDLNLYTNQELDAVITANGTPQDYTDGEFSTGKDGTTLYSFNIEQNWTDDLPNELDEEEIPNDYQDNHNAIYLKIMVNENASTWTAGDTLTLQQSNNETIGHADISALVWGTSWISPFAVDMESTLSVEYDGNNTQRTLSGNTLSNQIFDGPSKIGDYHPFTNHKSHWALRTGRRRWNLNLSFLDQNHLNANGLDVNVNEWNSSINENKNSHSLLQRVVNLTQGTHFPFIFQQNLASDKSFAICRFVNDDLELTRSGPNVYSVPMSLVESW